VSAADGPDQCAARYPASVQSQGGSAGAIGILPPPRNRDSNVVAKFEDEKFEKTGDTTFNIVGRKRAFKTMQSMTLPQVNVLGAMVQHQEQAELAIRIEQLGVTVLMMPDEMLDAMEEEIRKVRDRRARKRSAH